MKLFQKIIPLFPLLFLSLKIVAQPTGNEGGNLGQFELNVTEKYKAQAGEAVKFSETPEFEDTTTEKLPVNYRISSQPIAVKSEPEPLSPARIAKVPVDELQNGMVKLGFGIYTTPIAELYWNGGRSSEYGYGFWGKHFSTKTGVRERIFENNQLSNNELGAYYNRFYRKLKWETQFFGRWDKYSYYGIDNIDRSGFQPAITEPPPDPKYNWFRQYDFDTRIIGKNQKDLGWLDEAGLRFYNFSDRFDANENYLNLRSQWQIPAKGEELDLGVNVQYFNTQFDNVVNDTNWDGEQSNFTLQFRPKVQRKIGSFLFDLGINLYANNYKSDFRENQFGLYFFPEVLLKYNFVDEVIAGYAGMNGQLRHNSYRNLTLENPYLQPAEILKPTREFDVFGGLQGLISANTSYHLRAGWRVQKNGVLFYRDPFYQDSAFTAEDDFPALRAIYDNIPTFYFRGEVSMDIVKKLKASAFGELRSFLPKEQFEAWHRANLIAGVGVDYTFREKLRLAADLNYTGPREAFLQSPNKVLENTLPAYLAADLEFEYLYSPRLSAFAEVTNLLSTSYDLYLGYKAQGIGFNLGFVYRF